MVKWFFIGETGIGWSIENLFNVNFTKQKCYIIVKFQGGVP